MKDETSDIVSLGQFICGSTRCDDSDDLESWEVNFGYMEHGEKKNELVKVRLCPDCSYKLNYKQEKRAAKENKKRRRSRSRSTTQEDRPKSKRRRRHSNEDDEEDQKRSTSEEPEKEDERSIWSKPIEQKQEKSKEEEFEDYFADLLQ